MAKPNDQTEVPYKDKIADAMGLVSNSWAFFFRKVYEVVAYLGNEYVFTLNNNQGVALAITQLKFDSKYESLAIIDFVIQRTTTTLSRIEAGTMIAAYNPETNAWFIFDATSINMPDNSGVTISITAAGQVQYTSSNLGGTVKISRIIFRTRTLAGKSSLYSKVG